MATRSLINVKCSDDKIRSIYCHWDGYGHLPILQEHYNSQELADTLVSLGDLSSLGERPSPRMGEHHDFESPIKGVCVSYCRDRGEPWDEDKPGLSFFDRVAKEKDGSPWWNPPRRNGSGYREFHSLNAARRQDRGQQFIYEWDGEWTQVKV